MSSKGKERAALEPIPAVTSSSLARRRALIIGIDYRGTRHQLDGCVNDAKTIQSILVKYNNFSPDNVLVLSDEPGSRNKPTRANILDGMRWLLTTTGASNFSRKSYSGAALDRSVYYFHYSGHGVQVADINRDEVDGKDEAIVPLDFQDAGVITDDIINQTLVQRIPKGCKLYGTVDCCHSMSNFDLRWFTIGNTVGGNYQLSVSERTPETVGCSVILSACGDTQVSSEVLDNGRPSGALTKGVIMSMVKRYSNLTLDDLLTGVTVYFTESNLRQIPGISMSKQLDFNTRWLS